MYKEIKILYAQFNLRGEFMFICPLVPLPLKMFKLISFSDCAVDHFHLVQNVNASDQTHVTQLLH